MFIVLLLFAFIVGCLVSWFSLKWYWVSRVEEQQEVERHYEALLRNQLSQNEQLLGLNRDLMADQAKLRQANATLLRKYEQTLASLN